MIPRHLSTGSTPINVSAAAALALTLLAWPAPAAAQDDAAGEEIRFEYGVDGVSWYWSRQIDETLELGSVAQQIELPNPQSATTMPVAVELGENTKVAALSFNLAERGVTEGSTITDFKLTVAEGNDAGDSPTFNPLGKLVQACPITEAWSSGEAEMWDVQPPVGDGCVVGERAEPDPEEVADAEALLAEAQEAAESGGSEVPVVEVPLPTWTFDLTELAKDWGQDPFANYGVMFMPVMDDATPVDTWQVNLKLPLRDDTQTPVNEYDATAYRLAGSFAFTPGEVPGDGSTDPGTVPSGGSGGGSTGGGAGGGSGGGGSSGDTEESAAEESASSEELEPAAYEPFEPKAPWYVWTLIPAGLVGAYLLHAVMGASGAVAGGSGAIDRIRAHNLAKRGWALPVPAGLWQRLTGRGDR